MGRRKRKVMKPWCWYCNREFEDEKVLVYHQKSKHYRCQICRKKLYSAMGLSVHCMQVHKETITSIPNALPHRSDLDVEIFGMEGIPQDDIEERLRIMNNHIIKNNSKSINEPETTIMSVSSPISSTLDGNNDDNLVMMKPKPPPASFVVPPPPPPPTNIPNLPMALLSQPIETTIEHQKIQNIVTTNNNSNLLDLNQYKKFNVCITASSIIIHPDYDISLEEYRLSQREYRMCSTVPSHTGNMYVSGMNNSNVRPPTIAYGYLRMPVGLVPQQPAPPSMSSLFFQQPPPPPPPSSINKQQ